MQSQPFDMKLDRFANLPLEALSCLRSCDATGEIGHIGGPVPRSTLVDHGVVFHDGSFPLGNLAGKIRFTKKPQMNANRHR